MAFFIDIIPIIMTATFVSSAVFGMNPLVITDETVLGKIRDAGMRTDLLILAGSFLVWLVYCAILECSPMAGSLGKKAMGLKVCNLYGQRPGLSRALARNACKIFSAIPLYLGFFWALITPRSRGWHDWMTGTAVIER
jgi:uncharacterized RDD family membrane protein YckC